MRLTTTQEDEMGCGAACVAFAADQPYRIIVEELGVHKAQTDGFRLKELVNVLGQHGLRYKSAHANRLKPNAVYNEGTIVFIERSQQYPFGHYLIRHTGLWADSWINLAIDKDISHAVSGYRKKLPGKVQWILYPAETRNMVLTS